MGTVAAAYYAREGLTLSHYDAKAHLVVARRILDSLTPEYSQIGAVWLPLPHILNLLPVQIDAFYRTGAAGVAIWALSNRAGPEAALGPRGVLHMDIGFPPDVAPVTGRQGGVSISPDGHALNQRGS